MKLLIVDDQASVVEGLKKGIQWQALGIDAVYTAFNALDARGILKSKDIDIMLCDIEMPVENGLKLFEWMRSDGIITLCIFLTSHAEFEYAKEAIYLGAFDYVIQPAPYQEIYKVVQRAVKEVEMKIIKDKIYDKGKAFRQQEKSIASNTVRNFFMGANNGEDMDTLATLGVLPHLSGKGCLVLIQVVNWQVNSEKWESNLLETTFENIFSEIFLPESFRVGLAFIEENTLGVLLQRDDNKEIISEDLVGKLKYFSSVCEAYFQCSVACYFTHTINLSKSLEIWCKLLKQRDNNILLESGVFPIGDLKSKSKYVFRVPQIKHWQSLMKDGYPHTVEQQAIELLDEMSQKGLLDRVNLSYFYQEFIQMIYSTMNDNQQLFSDIFGTLEGLELYRNGMKSIGQMKRLIRFVMTHFSIENKLEDTKTLVSQVITYISENLEEDIRRDDLAQHVHLNPDYLTRIFKKEIGMTLKEYITEQKMRAAQGLLRTTKLPVSFVAAKLGYCNFSHFSFTYKKVMGKTPQEERTEVLAGEK